MAKYHEYIRLAISLGMSFDFDTGEIVTHTGTRIRPKLYGSQRYPSFTFNDQTGTKTNVSFPIHKFVAYLLYGEQCFDSGVQVRHLDGNVLNLSKDNILLGTCQENHFDKNSDVRKSAAIKARKSQGSRPLSRIVQDDIVEQILLDYFSQRGDGLKAKQGIVKAISVKYNLNRATVQSICSGRNFKDLYSKIKEKFSNV